jgi:hypothetical protein
MLHSCFLFIFCFSQNFHLGTQIKENIMFEYGINSQYLEIKLATLGEQGYHLFKLQDNEKIQSPLTVLSFYEGNQLISLQLKQENSTWSSKNVSNFLSASMLDGSEKPLKLLPFWMQTNFIINRTIFEEFYSTNVSVSCSYHWSEKPKIHNFVKLRPPTQTTTWNVILTEGKAILFLKFKNLKT